MSDLTVAENTINQFMLKDKLDVVAKNYNLIAYANFVVSAFTAYVLKDLIPFIELIFWVGFIYFWTGLRLIIRHKYLKAEKKSLSDITYWSYIFTFISFIAGLTWAYGGWFFIIDDQPHYITFIVITWVSMAAGAIGSHGSHLPGFMANTIPIMLAISARLFFVEEDYYVFLAFFACSLTGGFIGFARFYHKLVEESLHLRYEKTALLAQLEEKNQTLNVQIDKAKEANRQKSQFLAAASHDLRQPLQSLTLFSEVLQYQIKDNNAKATLEKIDQSIGALNSLFNALLDVSRLDAGDVKPCKKNTALGPLLNKLKNNFQEQAQAHHIQIKAVNTELMVNTDQVLLLRCLQNLVINAILHSGGNKILIGAKRRKQQVEIIVVDNGRGISVKEQSNIFKEFHQLNNPERDRQKGLGLGLAIVKRTTNLLGHALRLKSIEHVGTGFYLTLPRVAAKNLVEPKLCKTLPQQFNGDSILLIDDEKDIRESMRLLLEQWGAQVTTASGADDVSQLIRADFQPDAIISDYRLPGELTGAQLVEQFCSETKTNIPAMLITGDTAPERIKEAREHGLLLMHKPIKPAKLRMALNQILSKKTV